MSTDFPNPRIPKSGTMPEHPHTCEHRHDPELGVEPAAPGECPVCGDHLFVTRLGCQSCGSELAGVFAACEFCTLSSADRELLRVFLFSRGNLREVERHLEVSYPTARVRFNELLNRIGSSETQETARTGRPEPSARDEESESTEVASARQQILSEVASGALTPTEAKALLSPAPGSV